LPWYRRSVQRVTFAQARSCVLPGVAIAASDAA
jgi:hypothetical protein